MSNIKQMSARSLLLTILAASFGCPVRLGTDLQGTTFLRGQWRRTMAVRRTGT